MYIVTDRALKLLVKKDKANAAQDRSTEGRRRKGKQYELDGWHTFLGLFFDVFLYPFSRTPSKRHRSAALLPLKYPVVGVGFQVTMQGSEALAGIDEIEVTLIRQRIGEQMRRYRVRCCIVVF